MEQQNNQDNNNLEKSYSILSNLWASGIRDYHSLNSSYLTANSILLATIGILIKITVDTHISVLFSIIVIVFPIIGILICVQMAIASGRFRAQNAYWERNLRLIECDPLWKRRQLFKDLYQLREHQHTLPAEKQEPEFRPNFAVTYHRCLWASRMKILPWLFGLLYSFFILLGINSIIK